MAESNSIGVVHPREDGEDAAPESKKAKTGEISRESAAKLFAFAKRAESLVADAKRDGIYYCEDEDDDDEPNPSMTIVESIVVLNESVQSVFDRMFLGKDTAEYNKKHMGDGFEFHKDMRITVTGNDGTETFRLELVEAVGDKVRNPSLVGKRPLKFPTLAGKIDMLNWTIADRLSEFLWYDEGGEYEEDFNRCFLFDEDSLRVQISCTDGTVHYEPKLAKVEKRDTRSKKSKVEKE